MDLWRFLADPRIASPNNRAERALRPVVSARKGSQCAKHASGAHAFGALTSVGRTLAKQGAHAIVEGLSPSSGLRELSLLLPDPP
jgi:transposase